MEIIRFASYDCIHGLTTFNWGCELMLKQAGFFDFITSRVSHENKTEKEWKFSIIQSILKTSSILPISNLTEPKRKICEEYIRQGVFYIKSESNMDIASNRM